MIGLVFSRRRLLGFLALAPVAMARPALAAAPDGNMAARLGEALARIPLGSGQVSLVAFAEDRDRGVTTLRAQIALTWPPGRRRRGFTARAADPEAAFQAIFAEIETYFLALDPPSLT